MTTKREMELRTVQNELLRRRERLRAELEFVDEWLANINSAEETIFNRKLLTQKIRRRRKHK